MSAYANVLILKIKEKFDYKNNYEKKIQVVVWTKTT